LLRTTSASVALADHLRRVRVVLALKVQIVRLRLDRENALVDIDDAVDERDFDVKTRLGDDAHRLAQAHHQSLPRLIDREEGAVADDNGNQQQDGNGDADDTRPH
jgi:hypothetical protein